MEEFIALPSGANLCIVEKHAIARIHRAARKITEDQTQPYLDQYVSRNEDFSRVYGSLWQRSFAYTAFGTARTGR